MKEVVEVLARALVDRPDEVRVTETSRQGGTVYLEISAGPGDAGKIIGKQGRIARAIRIVANAAGARENMRVVVDIAT
jgi:predicted RNA-binding protein YlqC (UPF0109 family)